MASHTYYVRVWNSPAAYGVHWACCGWLWFHTEWSFEFFIYPLRTRNWVTTLTLSKCFKLWAKVYKIKDLIQIIFRQLVLTQISHIHAAENMKIGYSCMLYIGEVNSEKQRNRMIRAYRCHISNFSKMAFWLLASTFEQVRAWNLVFCLHIIMQISD